jgi:hypothetical protein
VTTITLAGQRLLVCIYRLCEYLHREFGSIGIEDDGALRPPSRAWYDAHNQGRALDLKAVRFPTFTIDVEQYWGNIPIQRSDGTWIADKGEILQRIANCDPATRLDPSISIPHEVVWRIWGSSVFRELALAFGEEADPTVPLTAGSMTDFFLTKLRFAARLWTGMLEFLGTQASVRPDNLFDPDPTNPIECQPGHRPDHYIVTPHRSGLICCPDGSMRGIHQDHLHFQIGTTFWMNEPTVVRGSGAHYSEESDDHVSVENPAQDVVRRHLLDAIHHAEQAVRIGARNYRTGRSRRRSVDPSTGAAIPWEETDEYRLLQRNVEIARRAFGNNQLLDRINTVDGASSAESGISPRARILSAWASGFHPPDLRNVELQVQLRDMSEEQAERFLVDQMNRRLDQLKDHALHPPNPQSQNARH